MTRSVNEASARELVRNIILRELGPGAAAPDDELDLVKAGLIDSMGWVGILSAIEEGTGIQNFGAPWPEARPQSIAALAEAVVRGLRETKAAPAAEALSTAAGEPCAVSLTGWSYALGSCKVAAESIERECGLARGTIRERAGIEAVCRAAQGEDEVTLGQQAAQAALDMAKVEPEAVDFLLITSATYLGFPSLAALLHTRLLLSESCAALDIGGACVGVIQALAAAKGLLSGPSGCVALVVASEVNSRKLAGPCVPGEFAGLFGDGACAFVLTPSDPSGSEAGNRLGEFVLGCSGSFASSLRISLGETGQPAVEFEGEQLASAAIAALNRVVDRLEGLSGRPRSQVSWFALHEPNPRIVQIFAERAKIPLEKVALISKSSGNLGSVTCGASLCLAMAKAQRSGADSSRPLIFAAAAGPGLLWGGMYLH